MLHPNDVIPILMWNPPVVRHKELAERFSGMLTVALAEGAKNAYGLGSKEGQPYFLEGYGKSWERFFRVLHTVFTKQQIDEALADFGLEEGDLAFTFTTIEKFVAARNARITGFLEQIRIITKSDLWKG